MRARAASGETNVQLELKQITDKEQQGQTPASAAKGRLMKQPLLFSGTGDLITMYMEKVDIFDTSFPPVFTGKVHPQASWTPEPSSRVCWSKELPLKEET